MLSVKCFGQVGLADFSSLDVDRKTVLDKRHRRSVIFDMSTVTSTDMTFCEVNALFGKLVRHYATRNERLQLLIVAPNDLAFGMCRMLQSLSADSDTIDVHIVRNLKDFPGENSDSTAMQEVIEVARHHSLY